MRPTFALAAVAATLAAGACAAYAAAPAKPEALVARPADTDRARGYWNDGRMAGATEMPPAVLDPVTLTPVGTKVAVL